MKIAVFHNFPAGGGKRTVYEQVKGLIKYGHAVEVFEIKNSDSDFCDLRSLGCKVHEIDFEKTSNLPGILARLQKDYQNFFVLKNIHASWATFINSSGFDVALVHTDLYTESPFILQFLKVPHVYHCHELLRIGYEKEYAFTDKVSWPKYLYEILTRKYRVYIDRINARSAQHIITNSKFTQSNIKKAYGRQATICYSGVDTNIFKPVAKKSNTILFMGQKNYVGGYDFVQKIVSLLPKKAKTRIINFGFPEGRPDTKNDLVLAKAYSQALATLCVSYNEPFGLKALESMACGTPALAVSEGGYVDSIIHGQTGWLLPRDPQVFATLITKLIKNTAISIRLGKRARTHVIRNWTWNRHVQQLEKILKKISHV
ncbi:MAG: glycosyltransferase family 4 protein [Patescibacteria group bacterium]